MKPRKVFREAFPRLLNLFVQTDGNLEHPAYMVITSLTERLGILLLTVRTFPLWAVMSLSPALPVATYPRTK
jgi:hypothetical protein